MHIKETFINRERQREKSVCAYPSFVHMYFINIYCRYICAFLSLLINFIFIFHILRNRSKRYNCRHICHCLPYLISERNFHYIVFFRLCYLFKIHTWDLIVWYGGKTSIFKFGIVVTNTISKIEAFDFYSQLLEKLVPFFFFFFSNCISLFHYHVK